MATFDRAKAVLESVRADVGVAEADLALNETNLVKATIVSPIAGIVLKRNIDPGSTSQPRCKPRPCSRSPRTSGKWRSRSISTGSR